MLSPNRKSTNSIEGIIASNKFKESEYEKGALFIFISSLIRNEISGSIKGLKNL